MIPLRKKLKDKIKIKGEWIFTLDDGTKKIEKFEKNLLVQSGLNFLAALLINEETNAMSIYCAYGTGTTAAASGDTTLEAEGGRLAITSKSRLANVAKLRTFFTTAQANGTWTEWGIFLAGTSQADSGTLLNRVLPSGGIAKTSSTVLTVEVRITFAAG